MKRITLLIPSLGAGGAERAITSLGNFLTENHFRVSIIAVTGDTSFYEVSPKISVTYLKKGRKTKNPLDAIVNNIKIYSCLRKNLILLDTDLIVSFTARVNIFVCKLGKELAIPVIISDRTNPEYNGLNFFWSLLLKKYYKYSSTLVIQSNYFLNHYQNLLKRTDRIYIIPNFLTINQKREVSHYVKDGNIILTVGRLDYGKGHDILLKAFAKLNNSNWILRIVGSGNLKANLQQLVMDLGINDNVIFVESTKDIQKEYLNATIFAFPSRYEGFPNALLEAMSYGLPCISTSCLTGPSELITSGKNGILINVNDINALSSRLKELIKDKEGRIELGKNARLVLDKFSIESIMQVWMKIIKDYV